MSDKKIKSVGIIMDGNRRWAKEKKLNPWDGHKEGANVLRNFAKEAIQLKKEYGLKYATFYAFSTENWNRDENEVSFLMKLFAEGGKQVLKEAKGNTNKPENSIRVVFVGERNRFSKEIKELISEIENATESNTGFTVVFALSYGGRPEIVEGVNRAIEEGEKVTEESFSKLLWNRDIPDPDIIIRTGGEKRLSNFLTWGSVYSELFFVDTYWPNFSVGEFKGILNEYRERERRHGK